MISEERSLWSDEEEIPSVSKALHPGLFVIFRHFRTYVPRPADRRLLIFPFVPENSRLLQ